MEFEGARRKQQVDSGGRESPCEQQNPSGVENGEVSKEVAKQEILYEV